MNVRHPNSAPHAAAFTLVELIGVLAIIGVLAAILVPQVLGAIGRSRVREAVGSYNSIRAGAITYGYKFGHLGDEQGRAFDVGVATNQAANWDREVLLKLRFIDQVFHARISTGATVQVRNSVPAATAPDGSNPAYNLAGSASNPNQVAGAKHVLDVRLAEVELDDARELNRCLDGDGQDLGESTDGVDLRGRVKYDFTASVTPGHADVYLYLTHL